MTANELREASPEIRDRYMRQAAEQVAKDYEPGGALWEISDKGESMSQQIENNFTYHAPKDEQPKKYEEIRLNGKTLAYSIELMCPNSREKSLAMTKLEEAVMWANAAIARNE